MANTTCIGWERVKKLMGSTIESLVHVCIQKDVWKCPVSGNPETIAKSNLIFPEIYCRTNAKMKLAFVLSWTQ